MICGEQRGTTIGQAVRVVHCEWTLLANCEILFASTERGPAHFCFLMSRCAEVLRTSATVLLVQVAVCFIQPKIKYSVARRSSPLVRIPPKKKGGGTKVKTKARREIVPKLFAYDKTREF